MTIDYVSKEEAEMKQRFTAELKRQAPEFLVLQYSTNGAPDREVVGNGRTSRWEFKHSTPDFRSPGDQELMCLRLAGVGHCRYVIWLENEGIRRTLIVHPRHVLRQGGKGRVVASMAEAWCVGFDMEWLVEQVKREHLI